MNSEIFAGVISFVMPYVVEFLKAKLPNTKGKWLGYFLAYGISILVGGATAFLGGELNPENVLASAGAALIVSQGVYNLYFKPKKIDVAINRKFS